MFNIISLLIGIVTLPLALIAFIPLLGWANWFVIPIALVGLAFGLISRGRAGRNLNLLVVILAIVRLSLGHGIF